MRPATLTLRKVAIIGNDYPNGEAYKVEKITNSLNHKPGTLLKEQDVKNILRTRQYDFVNILDGRE